MVNVIHKAKAHKNWQDYRRWHADEQ